MMIIKKTNSVFAFNISARCWFYGFVYEHDKNKYRIVEEGYICA